MQQMVFINDPVAGVSYSLNAKDHTGMKYVRNGDGRGSQRLSPEASGGGPRPRVGGPDARGMGRSDAADRTRKTESLGRQTIEGVQAEGRRTTMTIPAGQAGNDLPIHIVVESWYSSGPADHGTLQALGSAQRGHRDPVDQHQPQRARAHPVRSAGRLQAQRIRRRHAAPRGGSSKRWDMTIALRGLSTQCQASVPGYGEPRPPFSSRSIALANSPGV